MHYGFPWETPTLTGSTTGMADCLGTVHGETEKKLDCAVPRSRRRRRGHCHCIQLEQKGPRTVKATTGWIMHVCRNDSMNRGAVAAIYSVALTIAPFKWKVERKRNTILRGDTWGHITYIYIRTKGTAQNRGYALISQNWLVCLRTGKGDYGIL